MPWPGPVAYQVQSGCLTCAVISTGSSQVTPSSWLAVTQTVRGACPWQIMRSSPSRRFLQNGSQMLPVSRSTTGAGLPQTQSGSVATSCGGPKLLP